MTLFIDELVLRCHPRRSRRVVLVSIAGGIAAGLGGGWARQPAAARQDEAAPAAATPAPVLAGDGFVGEAQGVPVSGAFVAVVIADAKPGTEAREARASIYGDYENAIQEWFTGTVSGSRLDLGSAGDARLEGEFDAGGATGTITLADGTAMTFDAVPATGVAGLYTSTIFPDGRIEGTSESGARLEAELSSEPRAENVYPLTGTLTPADGSPREFEVAFRSPPADETMTSRFIVLDDGRIRGGAKKKDGENKFSSRDPFL